MDQPSSSSRVSGASDAARSIALALLAVGVAGMLTACCATPEAPAAAGGAPPVIHYVGSSTIGNFIRKASDVYERAAFVLDTEPESLGGENVIREGMADLVGVAREPRRETLEMGVHATYLGDDAIAVIVHEHNPVSQLTLVELRAIYTGKVRNWSELGGPDLPIVPLVVGPDSATYHVFRAVVLPADDYWERCREISLDPRMPMSVEEEPGAVGMISSSFLSAGGVVKVTLVEGRSPVAPNVDYPIVRPLYLLWWPGHPEVTEFIAWTSTRAAEDVIADCFGRRRQVLKPTHGP